MKFGVIKIERFGLKANQVQDFTRDLIDLAIECGNTKELARVLTKWGVDFRLSEVSCD